MSRFKPELNFATLISMIALFIALGGGAYAAVKLKTNQVKSKHIAPDAATGEDISEGTLGTVPSATNATNSTNAGNATTVGGFDASELQVGDGQDAALADIIDEGDSGGIILIDGGFGFECDATPSAIYVDDAGDTSDTDLWINGDHSLIPDGNTFSGVPVGAESTNLVHFWGGGGLVADVTASIVWDAGNTECAVAFSSQENSEDGPILFAAGETEDRSDRDPLPDGWVPLDGRR